MIVLTTSSTSQTFKIIPRDYDVDSIILTDDITGNTIEADGTYTQTGDFLVCECSFIGLNEGRFYTLRAYNDTDVVYKDKVFATNQGINQLLKQKYDINKNQYTEQETSDNDYIIL